MATRPNNHITGDSAVRKIASDLIPEEWTISIPDSDYGLDMLIEVVRDNKTTGKLFFIQSKGTTDSSREGVISFPMSLERIKDYSEIKLPVMFVYYSKTESQFWGRWMNPLYNSLTEKQKQQETISLRFTPENLIDVNYLRSIGDNIIPSITNGISIVCDNAAGIFSRLHAQVVATANKLIGSDIVSNNRLSCKTIKLSYSGTLQNGSVEIRSDADTASVPLRHSSMDVLFFPPLARTECPPWMLEIIYTIALFSSSFSAQSIDYALEFPQRGVLDYVPESAWLNLLGRISCEEVRRVQGLFDLFIQSNREDLAQLILLMVLSQVSTSQDIEVLYQSLLYSYLKSVQDDSSKGKVCYNLANSIRQTDCREAFKLYINAVHYEPMYRKAFYWWEEVGSLLYITNHYTFAELFYKQARRLSPNNCREDIGLLISDCLVCQGKIKEALNEESDFFDIHKKISNSAHLKSHVTEMMDQIGIQVFDSVYWFNLGLSYSREEKFKESMNAFLIAWRLCDGDLDALINALIEAFNSGEVIKMALILAVIRDSSPVDGYKRLVSLVSTDNRNPNIGVFLDALKPAFFQGEEIVN